jgi:hypothetical protein
MNLKQWQADADLIKQSQQLQSTELFAEILGVLREEQPAKRALPDMGATGFDHAYANGVEVGYLRAIENLEQTATTPVLQDALESTFQP